MAGPQTYCNFSLASKDELAEGASEASIDDNNSLTSTSAASQAQTPAFALA